MPQPNKRPVWIVVAVYGQERKRVGGGSVRRGRVDRERAKLAPLYVPAELVVEQAAE